MSRSLPPLLSRLRDADGLPDGIPGLSLEEKQTLAQELRDEIIGVVAHNGGHLAPSLGVVGLTLALLSVFDARRVHLDHERRHARNELPVRVALRELPGQLVQRKLERRELPRHEEVFVRQDRKSVV